jgi:ABC-type phosphate/phosphonate transport system permease subunit
MGDFIGAIGRGIAGLFSDSMHAIGNILRGMVETANTTLPGGLLAVVVFFVLLFGAWKLAKH